MFQRIGRWFSLIQKKRVVKKIRSHLEYFGCDTSEMSDEEIEARLITVAKVLSASGITIGAACKAYSILGSHFRASQP